MATETQIEKKWHSIERLMNIERIGNRAVKQAQEENRRLGIPNYYSINGKIICDVAGNDTHPIIDHEAHH